MKIFTLIFAFMLFAIFTTKATVLTVSNDPNQPAQWDNLQTAIDSSSVGDTIYVQGSPTDYGAVYIKKKLHIIGAGIKPEGNLLYGYQSQVSQIYIDTVSYISGGSGTIIEGLRIGIISTFNGSKDIIIRRNRIYPYSTISLTNVTNLLIYNNIIEYPVSITGSTNVIIMNNIIENSISGGSTSTIISNNVFLNSGAFSSCVSSTITNNVFYDSEVTGATYSNFSNNIGFAISTSVLQGTNTGANNLNADPLFLYLYSTTNYYYNDQNKYILKASSPGKNAGTDGSDIGIYGGQYPWPTSALTDYIHCIAPSIPMMQELNILNSSVPSNGNLNFSVKAYKTAK